MAVSECETRPEQETKQKRTSLKRQLKDGSSGMGRMDEKKRVQK
jgi:hypothetical protein